MIFVEHDIAFRNTVCNKNRLFIKSLDNIELSIL